MHEAFIALKEPQQHVHPQLFRKGSSLRDVCTIEWFCKVHETRHKRTVFDRVDLRVDLRGYRDPYEIAKLENKNKRDTTGRDVQWLFERVCVCVCVCVCVSA